MLLEEAEPPTAALALDSVPVVDYHLVVDDPIDLELEYQERFPHWNPIGKNIIL